MNKKKLIENNNILLEMVNSIKGISLLEPDMVLNQANLELFSHELKNNKDIIARYGVDEKLKNIQLVDLQNDKWRLEQQNTQVKTKLTLANNKIEEMDDALEEMKAKVKHSYIEAEVKHKLALSKDAESYHRKKYNHITEEYNKLLDITRELIKDKSSEDIKEVAKEFAKSCSPKIIIPDIEQKELTQD